ncbi:MAG TPA: protein kinase [Polyangia bacterium]|jgi:tetratricopeptide (TPR) repeat protein|nr:protein kinase [Polyangia bacterium]
MIGKAISGRFLALAEAGSGGMGTVYRARDLTDGSTVAVKVLTGREIREAARFEQEGSILAGLTHPAIVRYLASGIAETGERFIAMEWLDGEDLAMRLDRKPVTVAEAVAIARRAAEALAYAGERGIVHRDIKPENLFLPALTIERLKVLDFGIARLTRGARKLTRTGSVIGTPGYMAPELVRGDRDLTPGADVFSLGCVLFQCLTGRAVFEAEDATALFAKILLQDAPRARQIQPSLPKALDDVVARMLAKDPRRRFADARALIAALDGLGPMPDADVVSRTRRRGQAALTESEQRIACVVIAGPSTTAERRWRGETAALESTDGGTPAEGELRRLAALEDDLLRAHGAQMHPLPDGAVVLTLPDVGKATDQAARAARCALALRAVLPDAPLVVSTGAGTFSAWSVAGEVIDNGMRLLRGTAVGAIRLDDVAVGLLDLRFEVRREGTASFLRGERDVFEVNRNLLGKAMDFVGRGREMSTLTDLYAATLGESMASVVVVLGEAGIGKSRLREEFVDWVQRQPDRGEVLFGVGDSLGAGSPFATLGRAIRRAAGIHEGEAIEAKRDKLSERVARHVQSEARARVTVFLGEIANVPFPDDQNDALRAARANPQLMGDSMRRAWEDWLAAECAATPVLMVIEDLHWGDLGTVSFIDAALRNLRDERFMVLALARPDVDERFPDLWQARAPQVIHLGPLSRRASEKLVRGALGDIADAVVDAIVARADGNAFYLEELIRARADGRADSLPDSVLGMVQARLDAEGTDAKRVLRAAAVFGERFSRSGVAALLGGDAELADVSDAIERLAGRELVARAAMAEGRGDAEFMFAHALVREAAYAMLTDDDRMLGHRLAGAWLEEAGAGDAMALAEHFRRGGEPARAVRWYERAADQALRANDLGAAIERAEMGMQSGATGEAAGHLRTIQAEGHVWRGELDAAEKRALEAAGVLRVGSAAWLRAEAQAILAASKHGRLDVVEREVRLVGDAPCEADPAALNARVISLSWAANNLVFGGRTEAADALLLRIAELAGDLGQLDPQAAGLIHQVRAARASAAGDLGRCLSGLESALQAFEQAGDLRNALSMRTNLGYVYSELGDFQRAEAALRQALVAADRMGLHDLSAAILHNLGRVLGLRGELAEAEQLERRAVDEFGRQGDPRLQGAARTYLAEILIAAGDYAAAEREATAAIDTLTVAPSLQVAALGVSSRARLGRGDAEGALRVAGVAHEALERLGEIEEGESMVRLAFAEALEQSGLREDARRTLAVAHKRLLARAHRIGEPAWRDRFLYAVPVNARILALADEWFGASPDGKPVAIESGTSSRSVIARA